jgi:hypothetical protein
VNAIRIALTAAITPAAIALRITFWTRDQLKTRRDQAQEDA